MTPFSEMNLPDSLKKALLQMKFEQPTEIQAASIPLALDKKDIMACAQTGSGKTAAYCIPMIVDLIENNGKSALILAPTRELAQQIADVVRALTLFTHHLKMVSLVGGADIRKQLNKLKSKPRIIVATPGRLMDHVRRKSVNLSRTEYLVLDEGDRMIDLGFAPQLEEIIKFLPAKRQTLFFTATLSQKVKALAEKYLSNPQSLSIGPASQPVSRIKQSVIQTTAQEKDNRLVDELNRRKGSVIIFTRTKSKTDQLAKYLGDYGFAVSLIHGGRSQGQRNKALLNFKQGKYRILCATDVAARGIDIPAIEHVINYDLPLVKDDYVHRIGRTARNGASGEAISFVLPQDHGTWMGIAKKFKIQGVDLQPVRRGPKGENERSDRPKRKFRPGKKKTSAGRPSWGGKKKTKSKSSRNFKSAR